MILHLLKSFLFILLIVAQSAVQAQDDDAIKVLFVGNSYTYFWNLPQTVESLSMSSSNQISARQSTAGGANLGQHWRNQRGLATHDKLLSQQWDYVVLQDHSMRTIEAQDSLEKYVGLWSEKIKKNGASPVLYMTWSREWNPLMMRQIEKGYRKAGEQYGIAVVPVGKVWEKALELRPDLVLYDPDGSHPSPLGTYLTACTFYSFLTGKKADGLPGRLQTKDVNQEKLYLSIVSNADADFCHDVVDEVLGLDRNTQMNKK